MSEKLVILPEAMLARIGAFLGDQPYRLVATLIADVAKAVQLYTPPASSPPEPVEAKETDPAPPIGQIDAAS